CRPRGDQTATASAIGRGGERPSPPDGAGGQGAAVKVQPGARQGPPGPAIEPSEEQTEEDG
ncbi:MAG: hypothetical protein ACODAJ_15885, partial [Planctomycetota bacterium]